jgi:hypothetical protein
MRWREGYKRLRSRFRATIETSVCRLSRSSHLSASILLRKLIIEMYIP